MIPRRSSVDRPAAAITQKIQIDRPRRICTVHAVWRNRGSRMLGLRITACRRPMSPVNAITSWIEVATAMMPNASGARSRAMIRLPRSRSTSALP